MGSPNIKDIANDPSGSALPVGENIIPIEGPRISKKVMNESMSSENK